MLRDIERSLDNRAVLNRGNRGINTYLYDFLQRKYPWLQITTLTYNDIRGFKKHTFRTVNSAYKLHYRGKCVIAFYMEKSRMGHYSWGSRDRRDATTAARDASENAWWYKAEAKIGYDSMAAVLRNKDISYYGLGVFARNIGLYITGYKNVWVVGRAYTVLVI